MGFFGTLGKLVTPSFKKAAAGEQPGGYLFATTAAIAVGALALTFGTAAAGPGGAAAGLAATKLAVGKWLAFVGNGFEGLWEGGKALVPG